MAKRFVIGIMFSVFLFPLQRGWSEAHPLPSGSDAPQVEVSAEDAFFLEARRTLDAGQWREARRMLEKFIKKNKTSPEAWTLLGRAYLVAGANKKGKKYFDKALKFDPHFAPAYIGRGEYFEKKGRLDEATNDFRAAMLSDPNSLEARQALSRLIPE